MMHSFDIDVAREYGIEEAILLNNFLFWIKKNSANSTHIHDGKCWTYNTNKAMQELFPYLSKDKINYAIKNLVDNGLIVKGNYNKISTDRTTWYALTDKAYALMKEENPISQNSEMNFVKSRNEFRKIEKPLPDINTDINNTDKEKDIDSLHSSISKEKKRFTGVNPSKEEVEAYIKEKNFHVSADTVISYYTNNGDMKVWRFKDGSLVRDWKRCVCTCERNWKGESFSYSSNPRLKGYSVEEDEDAIRSKAFMKKLREQNEARRRLNARDF